MTSKITRRKVKVDPGNAEGAAHFSVEEFRVSLQHAINALMRDKGISRRELANRMHVTPGRVSQFFSHDCNVTIRTLAGMLHALGENRKFELTLAKAE